ncbi:3-isopropylmalate dehydrogenase [Eisenibacter elegans]|uniref:3-isopropylmalate dehydrogenase n=1 Tax=Eisenibacter elegans TaxID=997 RepID=UPI00042799DB|nr:3-isopropylmalate dehydrogenase [Eisenibacter elegans]
MIPAKTITILPGDGIGAEVTHAARQVLEAIANRFGFKLKTQTALIGHEAIVATGKPLPEETLAACKAADAVLLGAVGHPMYDLDPSAKIRPEQGLLALRQDLGLYANLRPIQLFDELLDASHIKAETVKGVDILFFRELTGDVYFGQPRERRDNGNTALDTMIYSRYEVERIAHKAFVAAQQRSGRLCSVDKANVLESSRLWRETVQQLAKQYPDVQVTHMYVDNAAMQLIKNPRQFDVVLTGNMFGDILTDLASELSGSLGMLPSASIGDQHSLYEPIHGSAPDIAGLGVANPMATILSIALMLEISWQQADIGQYIRQVVDLVLKEGYRTRDIAESHTPPHKILGTTAITERIIDKIEQPALTLI